MIISIGIVIGAAVAPFFLGFVLNNLFNSSTRTHRLYDHFWTLTSGALTAYAINFVYTLSSTTKLTTTNIMTLCFIMALPYIYGIIATAVAILLVIALKNNWYTLGKKITDQAQEDATKISKQMLRDAEALVEETYERASIREEQTLNDQLTFDSQINLERQELEKKKNFWMEEIRNLKTKLSQCIATSKIKDDIIRWLEQGNTGAADRAKKELRKLQSQHKSTSKAAAT